MTFVKFFFRLSHHILVDPNATLYYYQASQLAVFQILTASHGIVSSELSFACFQCVENNSCIDERL